MEYSYNELNKIGNDHGRVAPEINLCFHAIELNNLSMIQIKLKIQNVNSLECKFG